MSLITGCGTITSFIDHTIQIYVGQKATKNQWRVMILDEFIHTALAAVTSNQYQKYKWFSCTQTILGSC